MSYFAINYFFRSVALVHNNRMLLIYQKVLFTPLARTDAWHNQNPLRQSPRFGNITTMDPVRNISTATQGWKTPVSAQRACSPRHGGCQLCSICTDSSGEGNTIQFARAILVMFAATMRATPISLYTAAQGWMTPLLGCRAHSSHHGGWPLSLVCSISSGKGR